AAPEEPTDESRSFSATRSPSWRCLAAKTVPMPPRPSSSSTRYFPAMTSPGRGLWAAPPAGSSTETVGSFSGGALNEAEPGLMNGGTTLSHDGATRGGAEPRRQRGLDQPRIATIGFIRAARTAGKNPPARPITVARTIDDTRIPGVGSKVNTISDQ